jgi:hypothetical protein
LAFNGFGGQLSGIAIIWLAIEVAGPNGSLVSTAQLAVTFLVSLGASAFADRFTPRALMIAANLSSAAILVTTVSLGSWFGLNLWSLIATSMALAAMGAIFQPTLMASVPLIAQIKERIQGTNALLDATSRLSRLVGPFLAGPLSTMVPMLHFLTINAVTFLASALGVAAAGKQLQTRPETQAPSSAWPRMMRGYRVALDNPEIGRMLADNTIVLAGWFLAVSLGFPFLAATNSLDGFPFSGVGALAALAGSYGAGDFASNIWVAGVHPRRAERFMFTGYVILGCGLAVIPILMWVLPPVMAMPSMMAACFVAGVGGPMFFIPMMTFFQTGLAQSELGSLIRFRLALSAAAMMLGSALGPLFFGGVGPAMTILLSGSLIATVGILGQWRSGRGHFGANTGLHSVRRLDSGRAKL